MASDDSLDDLNSTLTDETQLLETKPETQQTIFTDEEEQLRYEELQKRFTDSEEKIEKFEQSISEISVSSSEIRSEISSDLIKTDNNRSEMIISNIHKYIEKLEGQFGELSKADDHIAKTTDRVLGEIDDTYEQLLSKITKVLHKKRDMMKLEAKVFKNESLIPLKACREEIHRLILKTKKSISNIEQSNCDRGFDGKSSELLKADRMIGSMPAVPSQDELPYLNFKPPSETQINESLNQICKMGNILRLGPVQIMDIEEKPASVFVKWAISDPEYAHEDHTYILQKAVGEVLDPTSDSFTTIYVGNEQSYYVKNVEINRPITLRVGIQSMESAWSSLRVVTTSIPNYRWSLSNANYMITNDETVATKINDRVSTLFSRDASVDVNQIIEFKFLEVPPQVTNDEGIALLSEPEGKNDSLKRRGALMINAQGKILMDGEEKLMQFPPVYSGLSIIFTITRRDDETLRINIECSDKAVTYYWNAETPLYFAARFVRPTKWNLMVK